MAIYKKRGMYWYNFWWNGVHIQKSTNQGNAKVARQIESAHKTKLAKGEMGLHDPKPVPTFKQAMEEFLEWAKAEHPNHPATAERYRVSSVSLLKYFRERMLDQIAPEDIEKFKAYRRKQKNPQTKTYIKGSTINRDLACLKALYNYHIRCDVRIDNPVKKVKFLEEEQEMYVLSYQEQNIYLAQCSQPLKDVAVIMLETGMRPEEIYRIQIKNIHLDRGYLFNPHGKTKAAKRKVRLNRKAREVIKIRVKEIAKLGSLWLFPSPDDHRKHVVKLNNAHYGALRRSKLRFRIYDLRHTWATRAAMSGIDLVTLAAMLGHSKINMVMRYAHPTDQHQASAAEKLEKFNLERELEEIKATGAEATTVSTTTASDYVN
jgi:integrase